MVDNGHAYAGVTARPNFLHFLFICFCHFGPILSLNFLFFLIGTNQFERQTFEFMAQEFARRRHKVVTVKPILIPEEPRLVCPVKPQLHMVHEKVLKDLLPERLYKPLERVGEKLPWGDDYPLEELLEPYWMAHGYACQRMLNSNLMEILASEHLELAILYTGNPCQLGFVHALGIPYVLVDLEGLTDETSVATGTSWVNNLPSLNAETMANDYSIGVARILHRRFAQAIALFKETIAQSGIPALASIVSYRYRLLERPIWEQFQADNALRRKFRRGFPDLSTLKNGAQLFLANTDPLLESPSLAISSRTLLVGGMHIDTPRPLFAPWNESIASAELGVILVSMGTVANTSAMPEEFVHSFLHAFGELRKYRIFWRISPKLSLPGLDAVQMEGLGERMPHLNITSFFPQNELLAHSRTRLLVTNGGMHSLQEALHWGVPVLGIPLFGQDLVNLEKVKARGYGTWLNKKEAKKGSKLLAAIREVLENPKFARSTKEVGRQIRSRPATAFERTLHAMESVARQQKTTRLNTQDSLQNQAFRLAFHLQLDLLFGFAALLVLLAGVAHGTFKLVGNCLRWVAAIAQAGPGMRRRLKVE